MPAVRFGASSSSSLEPITDTLAGSTAPVEEMNEYVRLQGLCARLYGLTRAEFEHVVGTFPLIPPEVRARALAAFKDIR